MFWITVIFKWISYSWPLAMVLFLADGMFALTVSGSGESVVITAQNAITDETGNAKGQLMFFLFMTLGPLLNIWIWLKLVSFFREAIEDTGIAKSIVPPETESKIAIYCLATFIGTILLPLMLWFYTSSLDSLWLENTPFWLQKGYWAGVTLSISLFFAFPYFLPDLATKIKKIVIFWEDKIAS